MSLSNWNKRYLKPVLIITLLALAALTVSGCEEFGQFPPAQPPEEKPEEKPEKAAPPATGIISEDRAILAVYEHLLGQAESHEAKAYLADFYTVSDNWSVESELFKDGASVWYVLVDMTDVETWEWQPHWQQAGWFVFKDGKVMPTNRLQANALRIEADLQKLSPKPEP